MKWLYQWERKFGRFCIQNLMTYICLTMLAVFILEYVVRIPITSLLSLNRAMLLRGQVWRLITFIAVPPATSILTVFLALYFYYFIGNALEDAWGAFEFNVYYLFGMIGAIIAALITGYGSNTYLNLSLFLAFAQLYPEERVMLFYLIPIKVKYLAYVDWALFALNFFAALITGSWSTCAAIVASLVNFFIFFGPGFINRYRDNRRYSEVRRNWKRQMRGRNNNPF